MAKTYKGSLAHILALPPIDWALLASERTRQHRHTPAAIEKIRAARIKTVKQKRREKRIAAELRDPPKPKRVYPQINAMGVLLASMVPGKWYGRSDMQALSGLKRGTVACTIIRAEKRGLITRTKNPAWERPGGVECEFLYRRLELKQQVANDVDDE